MRMGTHRLRGTTAAALAAGLLLTGCSAVEQVTGPDPEPTAQALADALATGDFAEVGFVGLGPAKVAKSYRRIVQGLGDVSPTVLVDRVEESPEGEAGSGPESGSGGVAAATLSWTWPLGATSWSYTTTALLTEVDDDVLVTWSPDLVEPSLGKGETLDVDKVTAVRAGILGNGGLALVAERPVRRFGIDRSQVSGRTAVTSARELADLVDIDAGSYAKRVKSAGDAAFVEAIVYRREDVPVEVAQGFSAIEGAIVVTGELPLAPTREFAAPILGRVGEVTAEMIEESPELYALGDVAGISGLQARYDEQLRGEPGLVVQAVGRDGAERELHRDDPVPGVPLKLTMDVDLQQTAERLLADVGPASALVAIEPSSGDLLAAANGPGAGGYNMATFGRFAPGSTFKAVSSLALLRASVEPGDTLPCTRSIVVDGKRFENYDDYPASGIGRIPFRTAVANSCNTAFISQADRVGDTGLVDAAASLGMGIDHDLGFPAYFGNVVPPASETEAAANLIGQGTVLASPMTMATVVASVQAGEVVVPRLVKSVKSSVPEEAAPLSGPEATALRALLREVVVSGSGRGLADVPGPPVIAKTGTAEYVADGGGLQTHAWMVAAQGDLAVAVFVETGDSGSGTAGPILEAFLRAARR